MASADPYAAARAQLVARLEREGAGRPDLPTIEELLPEVTDLQPLPAAGQRMIRLDDSDRFSAHELATIIASDQVLTARLLRLANSAFYGVDRPIGSVRDAVVLLGFRSVRQVALAGCFIGNTRPTTHIQYEDRQFSIATGLLAETLARATGRHQTEALTAGVMHNIGLLTLDQCRPEVLGEVLSRVRAEGQTRHDAERALLGFDDADLGAALTTHWNFPAPLVEAVQHQAILDALPAPDSLAALVIRARLFARSNGLNDGLSDRSTGTEPDRVPEDAELAGTLERSGGMEQLVARVDMFLAASLG